MTALTVTVMAQDALHRGVESTLTLTSPSERREAEYILRHQDVVQYDITPTSVTIYPQPRRVESYVA